MLQSMKTLYYPDGSFVSYLGSLEQRRILLILNRDNMTRKKQVLQLYAAALSQADCALVWYDFPYRRALFFRFHWEVLCVDSSWWALGIWYVKQIVLMMRHLKKSLFLSSYPLKKAQDISLRCESLKRFLNQFSPLQELSFLTQSAGGRIASLVAQAYSVRGIVCLGYPFKHPEKSDEPERYLHLETMTTPFLIFQGTQDEYGTRDEVMASYKVSPSVSIRFVQTNHDFKLTEEERGHVVDQVKSFLSF